MMKVLSEGECLEDANPSVSFTQDLWFVLLTVFRLDYINWVTNSRIPHSTVDGGSRGIVVLLGRPTRLPLQIQQV